MDITIYHNPDCGTSRNTLAIIKDAGFEPTIIEYLQTPPSREKLAELCSTMNMRPRDLIREKGTPFKEMGLDDPAIGDDQLIAAMVETPILINRPIVVTDLGTRLCRPSDIVLEVLPSQAIEAVKEEGVPLLRAIPIKADDALVAALTAEKLPVEDVADPGRTWFRFETTQGTIVGFGGYEATGDDALLRSVVILPDFRGRGIGKNAMLLLMRKAFDAGASQGYAATTTAEGWLESLGFKPVERSTIPKPILDTRQLSALCPKTATLWTRSLRP